MKNRIEINRKKITLYSILVLTAIAVALFAWSKRPSESQQKPSQTYQSYQSTDRLINLPPKEQASNKTTEKYTDKEIEQWAASRSDLAAQWNMADTAFIGLCVGGLGLLFIAWTLVETRGAAQSAADTLDIARETLLVTKRSSIIANRAYVTLSKTKLEWQKNGRLKCSFQWNNSGKTPAFKCEFDFKTEGDDGWRVGDLAADYGAETLFFVGHVIIAKGESAQYSLRYQDIFGRKWKYEGTLKCSDTGNTSPIGALFMLDESSQEYSRYYEKQS